MTSPPWDPAHVEAIAAIREAWPDHDVVLVGAMALAHRLPVRHRDSFDLDLAVTLDLDALLDAASVLPGWSATASEHRLRSPAGLLVDIVPASAPLIAQGYIDWPSGNRMSLVGFDLAFAHHERVHVAPSVSIAVPTAPVLAFLKMRAWLDRPAERPKDLADIAYLLEHYSDETDDRRFEPPLTDLGLEYEEQSAALLGLDLRAITTSAHRAHVDEFLQRIQPAALASLGPRRWQREEEWARRMIDAFVAGLGLRG
jgi:predicted nucleotidyltransferase